VVEHCRLVVIDVRRTTKTFSAGITTYSANAPARVTPTLVWLWQNSRDRPCSYGNDRT